jgi:DNA relaxase NicK
MKTTIDHLKFRTLSGPEAILQALRPSLGFVDQDLLTLSDREEGKDGWMHRKNLLIAGDVVIGNIDYGGEHQRGWVRCQISGSGCAWIREWEVVERLPRFLEKATIKRVDIALTTYQGQVTHDLVIQAHESKQFGTGGRHPHRRVIDGSDPYAGKTIYIGNRASHKYGRCYQKGWELLQEYPASVRQYIAHSGSKIEVDGVGYVDPALTYRCEVELKDEDKKQVPWSAVFSERDQHFAGSYPFFAGLLPGVQALKVQPLPEVSAKLALASAIDHCRRSYGATIRAVHMAYGGDAQRVLDMLMSEKPAEQLIRAGVLLVNHPGARETIQEPLQDVFAV